MYSAPATVYVTASLKSLSFIIIIIIPGSYIEPLRNYAGHSYDGKAGWNIIENDFLFLSLGALDISYRHQMR